LEPDQRGVAIIIVLSQDVTSGDERYEREKERKRERERERERERIMHGTRNIFLAVATAKTN